MERTHSRLHLSNIIDSMDEELCISDYKRKAVRSNTESKIDLSACADLGFSFEVMLEEAFKRRMVDFDCTDVVRLPEIERSNIVCSPDGFQKSTKMLHEYKLRWKSVNNFDPRTEWKIMTQIKGYLMALKDSEWCRGDLPVKCRLWVLFVVGDYRGTFPILRCYELTFTPKEIWDNWIMLSDWAGKCGLYNEFYGGGGSKGKYDRSGKSGK